MYIVSLITPISTDESLKYLEAAQLTQCINVRMIYLGFTKSFYETGVLPLLVSAMWKMLSTLPSPNALQECWFKFVPYEPLEEPLCSLGFLESPNLLHKMRSMFPNLKTIKIILGIYEPEKTDVYFEVLRQSVNGLRELEENGIMKVIAVNMEHVACHSIVEGCTAGSR